MTTETTMNDDADAAPAYAPYHINVAGAEASRRSLSLLIYRCLPYMDRQHYEESDVVAADPEDLINEVADRCADDAEFLLPDTPMKDAIFRVLLQNRNEPMDAPEISAVLTEKWEMTPFPRDTSPTVIQRLLDNSAYYCVAPVELDG